MERDRGVLAAYPSDFVPLSWKVLKVLAPYSRKVHLEAALGSRTKVKVLRTLFQETFPQFDASALADETGKSVSGVHNVLDDLVATGVVARTRRGRTHYFAVNRDHSWAQPLAELFQRERTQDNVPHLFPTYWNRLEGLAHQLGSAEGVAFLLLHGSLTRSPIEPTADVDLLVGLDEGRQAPSHEESLLGHEVSIVGMEVDRFDEKLRNGAAFAESVAERNVVLYRDPSVELPEAVAGVVGGGQR